MLRATLGLAASAALTIAGCQLGPTIGPAELPPSSEVPATATTAMTPGPGVPVVPANWIPIELPDAVGHWRANGVISTRDGLVVFGNLGQVAAAWTSLDGKWWKSVALPGGEGTPSRAAASDTATVLVGTGSTSRCAHPSAAFLWRRVHADTRWEPVPFDERLFCAGGSPAIAAQAEIFVVAGMGTGDVPFAWRSNDGESWLDGSDGLPIDLPPWALSTIEGGFLELGRGERTDARVSGNGDGWSSVEPPPAPAAWSVQPPGMDPVALVHTNAGLLAVYSTGDGTEIAAWRRDGDGSWLGVPLPTRLGDSISGGTAVLGRSFLFGRRAGKAFLLTSRHLRSWAEVEIPDVGAILGIATRLGRTVLVAATTDEVGDLDRSLMFRMDGVPAAP